MLDPEKKYGKNLDQETKNEAIKGLSRLSQKMKNSEFSLHENTWSGLQKLNDESSRVHLKKLREKECFQVNNCKNDEKIQLAQVNEKNNI